MKLYMDESGNGNLSQPLIVGAVEIDEDWEDVERRIEELYRNLSARRSLSGLPSFEDFRKHGFHASTDPLEISGPFLDLMQDISFKVYISVTDRTDARAGSTEPEKLEFMYVNLLADLLLRHRKSSELLCHIERNESLKELVQDLPGNATRRAYEKLGRRIGLPELNVVMTAKTQARSMAIIDYVMLAVSRWIRDGSSTNPRDRSYRAFREVEPFISVLYSLELGIISSRKEPLR